MIVLFLFFLFDIKSIFVCNQHASFFHIKLSLTEREKYILYFFFCYFRKKLVGSYKKMSSGNDENELKKCLGEIIELIESTILEESSYSNGINSFNEKKQILDKLTHTINEKLKQMLQSSSDISKEYFLDLFSDYHYDFNQGKFNETIKAYIIQQLSNDLSAIRDSFDAFQAAFNGNLSIVKHFIENYPKYKDKSGIWGTTLLYSASRNNHIHIVKYLIEQGKCDVNKQNKKQLKINPTSGSTPLHAACYHGHLNIVKYLIDNGADYFIKNYANETPIHNGFSRDNIRLFFQQFLIFSYNNLTTNPPNSTIEHDNQLLFDSIWEFKSIQSDQWIQFDQNQSNLLQKSLIFQNNKNYNQLFAMEIEKQLFSISVVQFLSSNLTNNKFLWIRCRGSSIINFNFYSKWQIMFHKYSSQKDKKSPTLEVFNIDQDQNIKLNQWYYPTQIIDQQLNYAMNYRRKFTFIDLSFINNESFYFNLETFSFNNNDSTIQGFIRWIPQFIITNTQTIIDNFNISNNIDLIPNFRDNSHMQNSYAIDLPTTTSTSHFIDQVTLFYFYRKSIQELLFCQFD
jgi:ankyrin repeat protein